MLRRPMLGWVHWLLPGARAGTSAACAAADGEPALPSGGSRRFRVLFCGEEFPWGFEFTREALRGDADIEVCSSSSAMSSESGVPGLWAVLWVIRNAPGACRDAQCARAPELA
jgi:hypothetical protein